MMSFSNLIPFLSFLIWIMNTDNERQLYEIFVVLSEM